MSLPGARFQAGVLCDPITAISGAVGIGSSLVGGLFKKKGANDAAKIQQAAADEASKQVLGVADTANTGLRDTTKTVNADITTAGNKAVGTVNDATKAANLLLDPYVQGGAAAQTQLNAGLAEGGQFNKTPTMADITIDPGYAFREQQDELAQQRLAAARGSVMGGGAAKALSLFSQGNASQEYAKAFERFRQNRQDQFSNLFNVAGRGQQAATDQSGNLINAGRYEGDTGLGVARTVGSNSLNTENTVGQNLINATDKSQGYLTGGANARASAKIAGGNAIGDAISGGGNAAAGAIQFSQVLKNPASKINYISPGNRAVGIY